MTRLASLLLLLMTLQASAETPVRSYQGEISIPTYEHSARETEPPLFATSTVTGLYPFTTYLMPYKPGPDEKKYQAVFLENEYLKITYIPEFGGRFFSVYDKLRKREMLYRNDVIKPAPYNPRNSWPQSGMELTGPHDLHTLTLHGEPFWANKIVPRSDGGLSLVLSETDPVYGMNVTLSATLLPGLAAVEIGISCYNPNDSRKPQMFWINTAISATPKTRFIYPMSRTVGHTTAEIADWPIYNGIDYSWDRNNKHMLGVFGIDIYDNFQGAYQFDRDYGIFRYADRRVVQGMKLWTFGYAEGANFEEGYTDKAGPYVELQSGRHVWDGHYEWVAPHSVENWSEWWIPVSGTNGLTTLTRDVALNLDVKADDAGANSIVKVAVSANRVIRNAHLTITAKCGTILKTSISLNPAEPYHQTVANIKATAALLRDMEVSITDGQDKPVLVYRRPDDNPGRKEYTVFTKPLESPSKPPSQMSVEELTLAAEYRLKELDDSGAAALLKMALEHDPGSSRAHMLFGLSAYQNGRYEEAVREFAKTTERDPYADAAWYYLAMAQFHLNQDQTAERNLYYIWPESAYYHLREYELGRLSIVRKSYKESVAHFRKASTANGYDLTSKVALAIALRQQGERSEALKELAEIASLDPSNRHLQAERWFLTGDIRASQELLRLTGRQTQEAINVSVLYRKLGCWKEAAQILELVGKNNQDPWGTTPEFYYTLAYCERRAGMVERAKQTLARAQKAAGHVDRFPYREESLPVLEEAVELDPKDATAHFDLACLLYHRGRAADAINHWQAAAQLVPNGFSIHRALGLAYAEHDYPLDKGVGELGKAIELRPEHKQTTYDLGNIYARRGQFAEQLAVLKSALQRNGSDDDLVEGILTAELNEGEYKPADELIANHVFAPRHRRYELRDTYRVLRYGEGGRAFQRGDYPAALALFQSALQPPVSLGVDTFAGQSSPRIDYYIGRTLESMGRGTEARATYQRSIAGIGELSGDRDSWNAETFFMLASLDRLSESVQADLLEQKFRHFAEAEMDSTDSKHRSEAQFLLGLIDRRRGGTQYESFFKQALESRPDFAPVRLELRGDTVSAGPVPKP